MCNQCTMMLRAQITNTVHLLEHSPFSRDFTFLKHNQIDLAVYSWPREDLLFERQDNELIKRDMGETQEIPTGFCLYICNTNLSNFV